MGRFNTKRRGLLERRHTNTLEGFRKLWYHIAGPHNMDYRIWVRILGSPYSGKIPFAECTTPSVQTNSRCTTPTPPTLFVPTWQCACYRWKSVRYCSKSLVAMKCSLFSWLLSSLAPKRLIGLHIYPRKLKVTYPATEIQGIPGSGLTRVPHTTDAYCGLLN